MSSDVRKSRVGARLWDTLKKFVTADKLARMWESDVLIISDAFDRPVGMKRSDVVIFGVDCHSLAS
jgi:hypothetical protein